MSTALSSEASALAYWQNNQLHILQSIANLCEVDMATAREVIETHIRRTELLCCRNARWISNNAVRFFLSELYQVRTMALAHTQQADRDVISIAMQNIRLSSMRTRQTQVDSQLSEYLNTHVPENILTMRIRHENQVDENQEVAQERTNDVVNFDTLNDVLLTHTLLSITNRAYRRRRRYPISDNEDH